MSQPSHELNEKIQGMNEVIDDALDRLHEVTAQLRPVVLDDFGLAAAIEWQLDECRRHSTISCRLENHSVEARLPTDQATALFRVFQETLTNVMRHAQADEVRVQLSIKDGDLVLVVTDNGRGITDEQINDSQSYGIMGIRERLHPWNGKISFEASPDNGTRVIIRMPYHVEGASP